MYGIGAHRHFYNCVCGGTYFRYPFSGLIIAGRHRIINHRLCLDYFVGNTGAAVVTINQQEISRFPCGRPNGRPERETR
ncbi:hypothetical protein P7H12_26135 [Paenibacillus larvae]|nr:hypothetical protein [Paenibacillus larvae]MDT2266392.1 hypothetical protein [Paenibacillus larvae]